MTEMIFLLAPIVMMLVGFVIGIRAEWYRVSRPQQRTINSLRASNGLLNQRIDELNGDLVRLRAQIPTITPRFRPEPDSIETLCDGLGNTIKEIRVDRDPAWIARVYPALSMTKAVEPNPLYEPPSEKAYGVPQREWQGLFVEILNRWKIWAHAIRVFLFGTPVKKVKDGLDYARIAELEVDPYIQKSAEQIVAEVFCGDSNAA